MPSVWQDKLQKCDRVGRRLASTAVVARLKAELIINVTNFEQKYHPIFSDTHDTVTVGALEQFVMITFLACHI